MADNWKTQAKAAGYDKLRAENELLRAALEVALPFLDNSDSPGGCDGKQPNCLHCAAIRQIRAAIAQVAH